MKRRDLLRHLEVSGCYLFREGARHTIYFNPISRKTGSVPRHSEIKPFLAKEICKQLKIPIIEGKK